MVQKILLSLLVCVFLCASEGSAQRARFDDAFSLQSQPQPLTLPAPPSSLSFPGSTPVVQTPGVVLGQPTFTPPAITQPQFATPSFDPFASGTQPFPVFPSAPQPQGAFVGNGTQNFQLPQNLQPQTFGGIAPTQPAFNSNFGPAQPFNPQNRWPYQGTGTNWLPSIDFSKANQAWMSFRNDFLPRVLERPRVRQTYIFGNSGDFGIGNELSINTVEVATTATIPRFLRGTQPLRISPGFAAHWWRGPSTEFTGVDLPARAFSAYLAADYTTDPSRDSGFDNNLTVGVYSDFDNFSSDSLRLTGRLVGWRRINEYLVGRFGVEYFDRVRVKLLPVFGIYANPNPDFKIDLAFPRSKISHRIPNFNNFEGWAYVGAEYGGGSWAIERTDGSNDQVDINDVRAVMGIEWIGPRRVTGFVDFGYVFERELVFRSDSVNDFEIQDSVIFRSGIAF